jgi:hypothetical protein
LTTIFGGLKTRTMSKQRLLDTKQMAADIEKPVAMVQRWARMRLIPVVKVGWRSQFFDPDAVRKALLKKTVRELKQ